MFDPILEHWAVRIFLIITGGIVITYPQWKKAVFPTWPDGNPMGLGFVLRWHITDLKLKFLKFLDKNH